MYDTDRLQALLRRFAFFGLFALAVTTFLGKPDATSLQALDSTTHAMIALDASQGSFAPKLPMQDPGVDPDRTSRFNDHPFPMFYLSGKLMRLFGPSAFSARLLACLFSAGCVLLLAWLGSLLSTPAAGLVAGLILMLSRDFILIGSRFHLDTPMVFFILLSFILWKKNRPYLAGIAAGLGLWMKTPVALLLYPSALLSLALMGRLDRKTFLSLVKSGLIALVMGIGVWVITGMIGGWDLVLDYFKRQVWGTAIGGRNAGGETEYLMGVMRLAKSFFPWVLLLIMALGIAVTKGRWKRPEVAIPLSAALVLEGVISCMKFKFFWYFIPIYPFLALLCVTPFTSWLERKKTAVYSTFIGLGILVPALLLATPIPLGPENFPALRKFEAIIQSYGSAQDQILYIDGLQPYGGHLDSIYELSFYTGRRVIQGSCKTAEESVMKQNPSWIVVSGVHLTECLSDKARAAFPVEYRFGQQFLLSRIIPRDSATDLTPLWRELRAPLDGKSQDYPRDPYFPR
ncbi:MAG: phospholipid carrier-dependent glycosyltransferase [Proteobacteria bacterium]|nr:phospholipid carrier-dependent glycosyltransferase [Pseudomonadota bacterium]